MFLRNSAHYAFLATIITTVCSCGENDIIIDDPNQLNPDIPVIVVDEDDSYQEHIREYDNGDVSVKLNTDVKIITPYQLDHLVDFDETGTVLTFEGEPSRLPKVGDKIIYSPYTKGQINVLSAGCMGVVKAVEGSDGRASLTRVTLEEQSPIGLDGFFDEIEGEKIPIVYREITSPDDYTLTYNKKLFTLLPSQGTLEFETGTEPINGAVSFTGSMNIFLRGKATLSKRRSLVELTFGPQLEFDGKLELSVAMELLAKATLLTQPVLTLGAIPMGPFIVPVTANISLDCYAGAKAKCSWETNIKGNATVAEANYRIEKGRASATCTFNDLADPANIHTFGPMSNLNLNGWAGIGVKLYMDIRCLGVHLFDSPIGGDIDVNLGLDSSWKVDFDPMTFEDLQHEPINLQAEASGKVKAEVSPFDLFKISLTHELFDETWVIKQLYIPPTYTRWSHKDNVSDGTTTLSALPTGDLLLPVTPGFSLYVSDRHPLQIDGKTSVFKESLVDGIICKSWWENLIGGTSTERISATYSGLVEGQNYTVFPCIGLFGINSCTPVFGSNFYTFTFGEEPESPRLVRIKNDNMAALGYGDVTFEYDDKGRIVGYNDPITDLYVFIDYDNRKITFHGDGEVEIWRNINTGSDGQIISFSDEDGLNTFEYTDGRIRHIKDADGETTDFTWDGGRLMSILRDDHDTDHRYTELVTFSYAKTIANRAGQTWYWGNVYSFLMRAGLLGKCPDFLPTAVTTTESSLSDDETETDIRSASMKFNLDEDGYIEVETVTLQGVPLVFEYEYE